MQWSEYNWPVCLNLVHYSFLDIDKRVSFIFKLQYLGFLLLVFLLLLKLISQIIVHEEGVGFIFLFLLICALLIVLQTICFYSAYRGMFYDPGLKTFYYLLTVLLFSLSMLNLVLKGAFFDGVIFLKDFQ